MARNMEPIPGYREMPYRDQHGNQGLSSKHILQLQASSPGNTHALSKQANVARSSNENKVSCPQPGADQEQAASPHSMPSATYRDKSHDGGSSSSGHERNHAVRSRRRLGSILDRLGNRFIGHDTPSKSSSSKGHIRRSELGKHANEEKMPLWLTSLLLKGGETKNSGILPVLCELLRQNSSTERAYLCDPAVQHISKLKGEGGFCGYRNIQMLTSYINGVGGDGHEHFRGTVPTIFEIQDLVEAAWDKGINPQGRAETGGIRGTRKYIGTAEAQAIFKGLGIPCQARAYMHREAGRSQAELFRDIEEYFERGANTGSVGATKVVCTRLAPVYFQHRGHSMTIVGLERRKDGSVHLLVFDPSRSDSPAIARLVGQTFTHQDPDNALSPYRRGHRYLHRYREFETLQLSSSAP